MAIAYERLDNEPRLLLEAELKPVQGRRFQPTGFADLGAARYSLPDGTEMILVESAQSVANRLEAAGWDEANEDLIPQLRGLPYVRVDRSDGSHLTNSILEAHRINSEYIVSAVYDGRTFRDRFKEEIRYSGDQPVDWKAFYGALLKYDVGSLLHGAFLEEIGGRLRATRVLSGFIEAANVRVAESGGVKNNRVQPELKGGEGNVPFHRTEFTAERLTAYFSFDLALLRGYGLGDPSSGLLIALALFKIRRFLSSGLRLRTACDLQMAGDLVVTRPHDFVIAREEDLLAECSRLIEASRRAGVFADPPVTRVRYDAAKKKPKTKPGASEPGEHE